MKVTNEIGLLYNETCHSESFGELVLALRLRLGPARPRAQGRLREGFRTGAVKNLLVNRVELVYE